MALRTGRSTPFAQLNSLAGEGLPAGWRPDGGYGNLWQQCETLREEQWEGKALASPVGGRDAPWPSHGPSSSSRRYARLAEDEEAALAGADDEPRSRPSHRPEASDSDHGRRETRCDCERLCDLLAAFAIAALLTTIVLALSGVLPAHGAHTTGDRTS